MAIELQEGDVLRVKQIVSVTAQSAPLVHVGLTLKIGHLLTVHRVQGEEIIAQLQCAGTQFEVDVAVSFSVEHINSGAIEILRPLEEEPEAPVEPPAPEPPAEPVDPDPPKEPPTMPTNCKHRRYSITMIRATTKRPEVFLYQGALQSIGHYDGTIDGWFGNGSAEGLKAFQQANGLEADGVLGRMTATEIIQQAEAAGYEAPLNYRLMSVIAVYETSTRRDAFGTAGVIGDNAGANYGMFQCNSLGSVNHLLKMAGRNDLRQQYNSTDKMVVNPTIKDWFGSADGIAAQVQYFEQNTVKGAMKELRDFGCFDQWEHDPAMLTHWERAVLLFCDSRIQNGTMWSGSRRPFWKNLVGQEKYKRYMNVPELYHGTWWDEMLGRYISYEDFKELWWAEYRRLSEDKKATTKAVAQQLVTQQCAADPEAQLVVLAQMRARSSWEKFWFQAVASRRITDATGSSTNHPEGDVNDSLIDLACAFQL